MQVGAGRLFKVASHHDEKMNGFDVRKGFFLLARDHDRGGRNAEKDRDAALLDILQTDRRVKALQHDDFAPQIEGWGQAAVETAAMKPRGGVDRDVGREDRIAHGDFVNGEDFVHAREGNALSASRRSGGVETHDFVEDGDVFRRGRIGVGGVFEELFVIDGFFDENRRGSADANLEGGNLDPFFLRALERVFHELFQLEVVDENLRFAIAEEVEDFVRRVVVVDRAEDSAELFRG